MVMARIGQNCYRRCQDWSNLVVEGQDWSNLLWEGPGLVELTIEGPGFVQLATGEGRTRKGHMHPHPGKPESLQIRSYFRQYRKKNVNISSKL